MYKKPFHITESVGNNAFSYENRSNKSLYVPSVIEGDFSDIKIGNEIVFEDMDENRILQSCKGLRNFVRMKWNGIPMIVFDNHNHALYFWYEAQKNGIIGTGNTLVHIDEHSDLWENENNITPFNSPLSGGQKSLIPPGQGGQGGFIDLEQVFRFTNFSCNVGNYIQPALREGIIGKVLRIEDTIGMGKYASYLKGEGESIILNLDLDFFAPELDYIPFEDKKRIILHFARQASLITVATSPFFIDQNRAIEMLGKVFDFDRN
ncbi:hypothetical protein GW819_00450 [Candidatus Gracilibacteria bacterium]|nr:hypothetical protein [Candidatus Gracilibacteria bacterium]PIQ10798.1 MAG: hypothetical protein COW68_03935 [Candidatus Gracilibacteria bacterium CG18_big_fil_WC_8_21_14_2_50_38_16]PIQ42070.1 MAG: hypothetical protein COW06_01010 [Candidatus Gracilibacteria bacterium CG12_big_fil_rev_8_21_14_0_65_38_15]PIZ01874.1 MAG: hypothetical protein COY60_01115 [Candidatus Gracilibacteria bacterium CG_4_10_14_0_8_um_filter_38_28]PJC56654.1 MAG: hypothetical protein CO024_01905 [Candidatus Gracilibacter